MSMVPVVFDLDGTLIDSAPDLAHALNRVMADAGEPPFTLAEVTAFVGNGIATLVRRAMAAREMDPAAHERLTSAMQEHYRAEPSARTRIYPGVLAALDQLQALGHPLGLCTNKPEDAARLILDQLNLTHYFGSIVGGGRLPVLKPDPAMLQLCIRELGGGDAIYVGDSEVDAETARAADLPFLLFTEGYRKSPAGDLPQTAAFSDFAELPWLVAAQG